MDMWFQKSVRVFGPRIPVDYNVINLFYFPRKISFQDLTIFAKIRDGT